MKYIKIDKDTFIQFNEETQLSLTIKKSDLERQIADLEGRLKDAISPTDNELLEYKIDQLSLKLDKYVETRETAASRMASNTEMRNKQISELQQDMAIVKNLLKLP